MTSFNINVNDLRSFCENFNSDYKKIEDNYSSLYNKMLTIKDIWHDDNVAAFLSKVKEDNGKISDYISKTNDYYKCISNFIETLQSISRSCNTGNISTIKYDSRITNNLVNNIYDSISNLDYAFDILNYSVIPSSFVYKQKLNVMKQDMGLIKRELGGISSDVSSISERLDSAFDDIKNCISKDIGNVDLNNISYKGTIISENLSDINYEKLNETETKNNKIDYSLEDLNFVNTANKFSDGIITINYDQSDLNYNDDNQKFQSNKKEGIYEHENSNYNNTSQKLGSNKKDIDFNSSNLKYKDSSKQYSQNEHEVSFKQQNIKTLNNIDSLKANDSSININKQSFNINNLKEFSSNEVNLNIERE